MPMAINTMEEYEKVVNVSWFTHEKPMEELTLVHPQIRTLTYFGFADPLLVSHAFYPSPRCTLCAA